MCEFTVKYALTTSSLTVPGAYAATDPGILINIYQNLASYVAPGPAVISGGTEAVAGKAGSTITATGGTPQATVTSSVGQGSSTLQTSTKPTSAQASPTSGSGNSGGCTVAKYGQCGGSGFTGCTTCKQSHVRTKLYVRHVLTLYLQAHLARRVMRRMGTIRSASERLAPRGGFPTLLPTNSPPLKKINSAEVSRYADTKGM